MHDDDKFSYLLKKMKNDLAKNMVAFAQRNDVEGINYWPLMMGACVNFLCGVLASMDDDKYTDLIEKQRIKTVEEFGELLKLVVKQ